MPKNEMPKNEKIKLNKLIKAFDLKILPQLYYDYAPQKHEEWGDWSYFANPKPKYSGYPEGGWYSFAAIKLPQEQRAEFRKELQENFSQIIGDVFLDGKEFCPTGIGVGQYNVEEEKILIPESVVDALMARNQIVPIQDIVQKYHDITVNRINNMEKLGDTINTASGYAGWSLHYANAPASLFFKIPGIAPKEDLWDVRYDYEEEQALLEQAIAENNPSTPFLVEFKTSDNRDTPPDAYILIKPEAPDDEAIVRVVSFLTSENIAPELKIITRSLVMKAHPRFVTSHFLASPLRNAFEALGGGGKPSELDKEMSKQDTGTHDSYKTVMKLRSLGDNYNSMAEMVNDKNLPNEVLQTLYALVPATKPIKTITSANNKTEPLPTFEM